MFKQVIISLYLKNIQRKLLIDICEGDCCLKSWKEKQIILLSTTSKKTTQHQE